MHTEFSLVLSFCAGLLMLSYDLKHLFFTLYISYKVAVVPHFIIIDFSIINYHKFKNSKVKSTLHLSYCCSGFLLKLFLFDSMNQKLGTRTQMYNYSR